MRECVAAPAVHFSTSDIVRFAEPDEEVLDMLESARERHPATTLPSSALRVSFKNARGLRLAGELLLSAAEARPPVVVFIHGWGSDKESPENRAVAEALTAAGIAAFLFDLTGHGDSEGTEEDITPEQEVDDLAAAIGLLGSLDEIDSTRIGIVGAGSGVAAAVFYAGTHPGVRALVLRSGHPEGVESVATRVTAPTLLIVDERDVVTREANEKLLLDLAGSRRLEIVPGAGRVFGAPPVIEQVSTLTTDWFVRHLV